MYKNQLQELAQRSCFNLPSYACIREGPDHAPRFKATVNFNGETFESPQYCSTLRQAEHSAAEVALNSLATRSPSYSLAARILESNAYSLEQMLPQLDLVLSALLNDQIKNDETGVYKNLLQEIAQRVGAPLPQYTTYRSGLGHLPVFTGLVELAGIIFTGEPAKNKKQAEKNAALAAWISLKQLAKTSASSSSEPENTDELEQITIARALLNYRTKEKAALANSPSGSIPFTMKFPSQSPRPTSPQPQSKPTSKILPLICPRNLRHPLSCSSSSSSDSSALDSRVARPHRFPAPGAAPYVPIRPFRMNNVRGMAPPVTIRNMIPVFSAPPVNIRQAVPVFAAPAPPMKEDQGGPHAQRVLSLSPSLRTVSIKEAAIPVAKKEDAPGAQKDGQEAAVPVAKKEDAPGAQKEVTDKGSTVAGSTDSAVEDLGKKTATDNVEEAVVHDLKELKI